MKKILVIDFHDANINGGVAKFNRNLFGVLKDKFNILHGCFFNTNKIFFNENIVWKVFNYITGYRIPALYFKFLIDKEKPDICIVNYPVLARYIKNNSLVKLILIQHQSVDILLSNRANLRTIKNKYAEIKKYEKIIVFTNKDKQDFLDNFIIDNRKIEVIPHMVNFPIGSYKNISNKKILMLARLDNNQKRFDLAISIMGILKDFKLSIYGDGKDKGKIQKLISRSKCKNIELYPYSDDVVSIYDQHDYHLMVSDFEGFGLTNIEAISRGLPIIVRDTFSAAEFLCKDCGALVSSNANQNDIANIILEIDDNYLQYSRGAIARAKEYSSDTYRRKWLSFLNQL
ncbi:glycosyltransferase [Photobacterium carnosum]|uniref:glycosyltransferase n=1 Tax=Photobacterium carnosum TaxID=2023717 RepID=UPI001E40D55F|nr:glycosyltransferase [Photobacterium carnosum]MCD9539145.1 glycosyltransferase [Photobacterium carnosum]MCF2163633.1 glycosyltransferase [Photobacterium carnosum]